MRILNQYSLDQWNNLSDAKKRAAIHAVHKESAELDKAEFQQLLLCRSRDGSLESAVYGEAKNRDKMRAQLEEYKFEQLTLRDEAIKSEDNKKVAFHHYLATRADIQIQFEDAERRRTRALNKLNYTGDPLVEAERQFSASKHQQAAYEAQLRLVELDARTGGRHFDTTEKRNKEYQDRIDERKREEAKRLQDRADQDRAEEAKKRPLEETLSGKDLSDYQDFKKAFLEQARVKGLFSENQREENVKEWFDRTYESTIHPREERLSQKQSDERDVKRSDDNRKVEKPTPNPAHDDNKDRQVTAVEKTREAEEKLAPLVDSKSPQVKLEPRAEAKERIDSSKPDRVAPPTPIQVREETKDRQVAPVHKTNAAEAVRAPQAQRLAAQTEREPRTDTKDRADSTSPERPTLVPREIKNYKTEAREDNIEYTRIADNKVAFRDFGKRVTMEEKDYESTRDALKLASMNMKGQLLIRGSDEFQRNSVKAAMELGLFDRLKKEESIQRIHESLKNEALEKDRARALEQNRPSQQTDRSPERSTAEAPKAQRSPEQTQGSAQAKPLHHSRDEHKERSPTHLAPDTQTKAKVNNEGEREQARSLATADPEQQAPKTPGVERSATPSMGATQQTDSMSKKMDRFAMFAAHMEATNNYAANFKRDKENDLDHTNEQSAPYRGR